MSGFSSYIHNAVSSQIINTFTEAVQTVDAKMASGKLHTLWVAFAQFYENADQLEDVRICVVQPSVGVCVYAVVSSLDTAESIY